MTMSGNVTAFAITGGAAGDRLELWLTGHASNTYTFTTTIAVPSDSLLTFPKNITAAKTWIFVFKYVNGAWRIVSCVGGF